MAKKASKKSIWAKKPPATHTWYGARIKPVKRNWLGFKVKANHRSPSINGTSRHSKASWVGSHTRGGRKVKSMDPEKAKTLLAFFLTGSGDD